MNKKYTYLILTPIFPSKDNFVGNYIFDQIKEIEMQSNYNISVIKVSNFFSKQNDYMYEGFNVKVFKVFDLPFFIFPGLFNKINQIKFKLFLKKNKINNIKFIHSHISYPSAYLISSFNVIRIIQHHGLDVLQLMNCRFKFFRRIQRKYLINKTIYHLNKFDYNIGVSKKVLNKLGEFGKYNPKNEIVLYNGINKFKFFPTKSIFKKNIFTIGCVSNFWKIKDHITLIKAVKKLSDEKFNCMVRFIGEGLTKNECLKFVYANKMEDYIIFEKERKHNELNSFYNEIDLFVLPSYFEALGCVYLESWATNTPFIAVKNQGISEIINKNYKSLFLINKEDHIQLSNKIRYIAEKNIKIKFNKKYHIDKIICDFLKKINNIYEF